MKENQHNDNLERFFKANLENYSPQPSDDFWDRMGTAIPPRPPFWTDMFSKTGKWIGLGILLLIFALVLWFWHHDRSQIMRLKQTVAQQQRQIQAMDKPTEEEIANPAIAASSAQQQEVPASQNSVVSTSQSVDEKTVSSQKKQAARSITKEKPSFFAQPKNRAKSQVSKPSPTDLVNIPKVENQPIGKEPTVRDVEQLEALSMETASNSVEVGRSGQPLDLQTLPGFLPSKEVMLLSKTKRALAVKPSIFHPKESYPKYAVEVGGSIFRMSLGRLFQQDTFLTGRTGTSYETGFNISYEVNRNWALQAGYQFTNLRARRLALRYNSFPVAVQKRWAWGRRRHVEAKIGASLNSLVSARTDSDGQSVKGLKPTWIGLHGGLATTWSLTENLTLIAGPSAGFSLSPMTNGRRSWDVGLGASLRYHL